MKCCNVAEEVSGGDRCLKGSSLRKKDCLASAYFAAAAGETVDILGS